MYKQHYASQHITDGRRHDLLVKSNDLTFWPCKAVPKMTILV